VKYISITQLGITNHELIHHALIDKLDYSLTREINNTENHVNHTMFVWDTNVVGTMQNSGNSPNSYLNNK